MAVARSSGKAPQRGLAAGVVGKGDTKPYETTEPSGSRSGHGAKSVKFLYTATQKVKILYTLHPSALAAPRMVRNPPSA